jgi:hypothetical protein
MGFINLSDYSDISHDFSTQTVLDFPVGLLFSYTVGIREGAEHQSVTPADS